MIENIDEVLRVRISNIQLMIFDVDGVLTDGRIIYNDDGTEIKAFDVRDGHGIKLLMRAGLEVAMITGRYCRAVEHRAKGLGITRLYQNSHYKLEAYEKILADTGLSDLQAAYMGDDLIDIPVMRRVGLAVSVPDASSHVIPYAHYVTSAKGGWGAAREICELILQVRGLWNDVTMRYFQVSS